MSKTRSKTMLNYINRLEKTLDELANKLDASENEVFERIVSKMSCKQACPYNTLSGCKKDELNNGICIITETKNKSEWISVKERLPERDEKVIAYYGFGTCNLRFVGLLDYYAHDPKPHWQHESTGVKVTHWMPLPEPPKEEKHE